MFQWSLRLQISRETALFPKFGQMILILVFLYDLIFVCFLACLWSTLLLYITLHPVLFNFFCLRILYININVDRVWKGFVNGIFFRKLSDENGECNIKGNAAGTFFSSNAIFSSRIRFYGQEMCEFKKKSNSIGATVQKLFTVEDACFAFIRVSMENVYIRRLLINYSWRKCGNSLIIHDA